MFRRTSHALLVAVIATVHAGRHKCTESRHISGKQNLRVKSNSNCATTSTLCLRTTPWPCVRGTELPALHTLATFKGESSALGSVSFIPVKRGHRYSEYPNQVWQAVGMAAVNSKLYPVQKPMPVLQPSASYVALGEIPTSLQYVTNTTSLLHNSCWHKPVLFGLSLTMFIWGTMSFNLSYLTLTSITAW